MQVAFGEMNRGLALAGQDLYNERRQAFGASAQGLAAEVLDGMLGVYGRIVGRAPHAGHTGGRRDEPVSADSGGGDASILNVNSVVHTARAARPSITYRDDD